VADAGELGALRERVEQAYRVLSDADARSAYDAALGRLRAPASYEPDPRPRRGREGWLAPRSCRRRSGLRGSLGRRTAGPGHALRRTRLARGLELDQINKITKVNPLYLRSIEEERFDALPASVYVRGFVAAYARCLGLDAGRVANDYLERLQAARPDRPPKRRR
jgi:flagellar biosynthesis protein FlhG